MSTTPTSGPWFYRQDGDRLKGVAAKLRLDEREVVRRIVHAYLSTNAEAAAELPRVETDTEAEEAMEVTISANVELFHELLEETDDLFIRTDGEGRLTYLNPAAAAMAGTPMLEGLGRAALTLLLPEDQEGAVRAFTRAIARRQTRVRHESRLASPAGEIRHLAWNAVLHYDAEGRLVSVTAIGRDLTERYQLEAVHDRNQRALLDLMKQRDFTGSDLNAALKSICQAAGQTLEVERVGVWLYRDNDTRIECVELYQKGAQLHSAGGDLLAADAPNYFKALEEDRVISAGDAPKDARTAELAAYLEAHHIGAMLDAPIHIAGKTAGVICHEHVGAPREWSLEDQNFAASLGDLVSLVFEQAERRRAELEILRQTVALEKAQDLNRMMSDFVNLVAHELRTPLTSVLGFVELTEDNLTPDEQVRLGAYLQQIRLGFTRLARLIDDLLDFARIEAGTFKLDIQPAELTGRIREVTESLVPQALNARVKVETALPDQPIELAFDPVRIGQVLINLIGNAIKYTSAGGQVTVAALIQEDAVRVEVRDTGSSIPPEDLPRLFTKFTRLPSAGAKSGVGLGLYISKALIEAHGGTIGAESVLHQGSTFWFTLPRHPEASAE